MSFYSYVPAVPIRGQLSVLIWLSTFGISSTVATQDRVNHGAEGLARMMGCNWTRPVCPREEHLAHDFDFCAA